MAMQFNIEDNNKRKLMDAFALSEMKRRASNQDYAQKERVKDQNIRERVYLRDDLARQRIGMQDILKRQGESRKPQIAVETQAKKNLNTYSSDANQILVSLDKLEKEAVNLGDFERGVPGQIKARLNVGVQKFAKDKKINRYMGVMAQELIPLARKLMEEKGPITEFDVARVEKGLGELTTPLEDKLFLIGEMRNKVKQALISKSRLAGGQESSEQEYGSLLGRASHESGSGSDIEERKKRLRNRYLGVSNA